MSIKDHRLALEVLQASLHAKAVQTDRERKALQRLSSS